MTSSVVIIDTQNGGPTSGIIPEGCKMISIWNAGGENATIGTNVILYPDQALTLPYIQDSNYGAYPWDKGASELYILYIK